MPANMTAHLFKLSVAPGSRPISEVIEHIAAQEHRHKTKQTSVGLVGLEQHERIPDTSFWRLGFDKLRFENGPGRGSRAAPAVSFELDPGEGFTESTAMFLDANLGWAVCQFNQTGPRASTIGEFLSSYVPNAANSYRFLLQLEPDVQAKLAAKTIFTSVEVQVAPAMLSEQSRENDVGLYAALDNINREMGHGSTVSVTVSVHGRQARGIDIGDKIWRLVNAAEASPDAFKALVVKGRDDDNAGIEPLDLLSHKLKRKFTGIRSDQGLRLDINDRWNRLQIAYDEWLAAGIIR